MLVSPRQKVIFDVRVENVGHFPLPQSFDPLVAKRFSCPLVTLGGAQGGQMINLGQMTTSSSSSTGGRVGQGTNDRGSRASSSQQDPTKSLSPTALLAPDPPKNPPSRNGIVLSNACCLLSFILLINGIAISSIGVSHFGTFSNSSNVQKKTW